MYELSVLDGNSWKHFIVYKLFVLDRNTWNHLTSQILLRLIILSHYCLQMIFIISYKKPNICLKRFDPAGKYVDMLKGLTFL